MPLKPTHTNPLNDLTNGTNLRDRYGKPHDSGAKPPWPTAGQIDALRRLGYCPSVFTLEAGEFLHINKGRLHAFRKKQPALLLGGADASGARAATATATGVGSAPEEFCVSVAWDWLYQGSSPDAVAAEVAEPLINAAHNVREGVPSLVRRSVVGRE